MRRTSIICLASLLLASAPPGSKAASRDAAQASRRAAEKAARTESSLLPGKPIKSAKPPEEKPHAGWSGFYFGLNAGAAAGGANR